MRGTEDTNGDFLSYEYAHRMHRLMLDSVSPYEP